MWREHSGCQSSCTQLEAPRHSDRDVEPWPLLFATWGTCPPPASSKRQSSQPGGTRSGPKTHSPSGRRPTWPARFMTLEDLPAARQLQERGPRCLLAHAGPEHLDTLRAMGNLATTLDAQGDLHAACQLQEKTLEACSRTLGPEHPNTLLAQANPAVVLYAQEDFPAPSWHFGHSGWPRASKVRIDHCSRPVLAICTNPGVQGGTLSLPEPARSPLGSASLTGSSPA